MKVKLYQHSAAKLYLTVRKRHVEAPCDAALRELEWATHALFALCSKSGMVIDDESVTIGDCRITL